MIETSFFFANSGLSFYNSEFKKKILTQFFHFLIYVLEDLCMSGVSISPSRRSREAVSVQNQMLWRARGLVKNSSLTWQIKYSRGVLALLWGGATVKNLQAMNTGKNCVQPEHRRSLGGERVSPKPGTAPGNSTVQTAACFCGVNNIGCSVLQKFLREGSHFPNFVLMMSKQTH